MKAGLLDGNFLNSSEWVNGTRLTTGTPDPNVHFSTTFGSLTVTTITSAGNHYNGMDSAFQVDFTNTRVVAKIVPTTDSTDNSDSALLTIGADINNQVQMFLELHLGFFWNNLGVGHQLPAVNYDPVAHLYWSLRETNGIIFYETAPDGITWTTQAQIAEAGNIGWDPTNVWVELSSGTFGSTTQVGPTTYSKATKGGSYGISQITAGQ